MAEVTGIASGALNAYALKQAVTASNIARANTSDAQASTAVLQSASGGGVTATVTGGTDKVDISREAVNLLSTGSSFKSNLKVLSADDEMKKTLFSIKA